MALCWSKALLLLHIFSTFAHTAETDLPLEITNFIPSCARECFATFLDTNYASTSCGDRPTLGCLCKTKGKSEYTVGEGAIQCVLSQISINACDDESRKGGFAQGVVLPIADIHQIR